MDLTPKSQSPPRRRLTARRSPSLRRALRSSRLYMVTRMAAGRWRRRTGTRNEFVRGAHSDPRALFSSSMALHSLFSFILLVVRPDRPIYRSWIDFGRNIVRGRSVRRHPCLFAAMYLLPCLPSSHSHSLPSSRIPVHSVLQQDIGVHVLSRDVSHLH
jgi:hypothetical protein